MIARPIRQAEFGEPVPVTIDDMLNEISNQGPAIPAVMDSVQPQLESLDPNLFSAASHIYITGCGDSYFAGLAARYAFTRYAGIPTDALEALEFGRYTLPSFCLQTPSSSASPTRARPPAPSKPRSTPVSAARTLWPSPAIRKAGWRRSPTPSSTRACALPAS